MIYPFHESLVKTANSLPPLPQSVVRLTDILGDPDYDVKDVVRVVEVEPTLAGRVLRMANSALYSSGKVSTIQGAIVRLGTGTVRSLAMSESVRPRKDIDLSAFGLTPETYWSHSVAVLSFAEEMAAQRIARFGDDLPTAALLHDFGKLVLSRHVSPEMIDHLNETDSPLTRVQREMAVFSVDHAEVTAVVAQAWKLPENIVRAVQYHHNPVEYDSPICHGLHLANHLAWKLEAQNFELESERATHESSTQSLRISEESLDRVFREGKQRFEAIHEFFNS